MRLDHLLSREEEVRAVLLFWCQGSKEQGESREGGRSPGCLRKDTRKKLAAMRPGETHVPIPNTMVKARAADGTMPGTAWESRRLPA